LLIAAVSLAACSEESGRLYVEITSSLSIPRETNALVVRVQKNPPGSGDSGEKSYLLGEPPRDVWPQVLPILGDGFEADLAITVELRLSRPAMPSVGVGFGEKRATLPRIGSETITLDVARSCEDRDGDTYGTGFGCSNPDCDDTRPDVPFPIFCPNDIPPVNDAGVPPPPDSGVPEPDGGVSLDADLPDADDPGLICELVGTECPPDQVCFSGRCWDPCQTDIDCSSINEACLEQIGICVCRVPCDVNTPETCVFGDCIDGCCDF
jgi:hypothetical protein